MKNVVLVDDDPTARKLLKTLFELDGFHAEARSSISAEQILSLRFDTRPGLLVMDVYLGSINGLELVKQVRQAGCASKDLRIILTSGMDLRIEAAEAGADGFLTKPYAPDDLFQLIRKFQADQTNN